MNKTIKFLISVVLCQAAGITGAFFTGLSVNTWYPTLNKPPFNPPNAVFGPVWTTLYLFMGISFYLIWDKQGKADISGSVKIFLIQLCVNILWSAAFFGARSPLYGFIVILILWILILLSIMKFFRISKTAAYLFIPYLMWVSFAAVLNYSLLVLNL